MDSTDEKNLAWVLRRPSVLTANPLLIGLNSLGGDLRLAPALVSSSDGVAESIPNKRLGHYFEALVQKILTSWAGFDKLVFNLQIHDAEKTLGEVDALLLEKTTHRAIHLEMALKFYLLLPDHEPSLESFLGPDPTDNLGKKWEYMKNRQLALSDTDAFKAQAPDWGREPHKQALLLGRLFEYYRNPGQTLPTNVDPTSLSGIWIHWNNPELSDFINEQTVILTDRRHWLADPPTPQPTTHPKQQLLLNIKNHFESFHFALMLFNHDKSLPSRIMLVAKGWPDKPDEI